MFTITIPFQDIKAIGFQLPGKPPEWFPILVARMKAEGTKGGELVIEKRQEGERA